MSHRSCALKVDLITETHSDLTVVNAARCSFDKQVPTIYITDDEGLETKAPLLQQDVKLIKYLADHQHWTPFGHPQEAFQLIMSTSEQWAFFRKSNLSGFEWVSEGGNEGDLLIRGSLYAWLMNMKHLPQRLWNGVYEVIRERYPISFKTFYNGVKAYDVGSGVAHLDHPIDDELVTYTLRIHCPIFVKRQLETHRRGFVMTDIEDFSQNEVSRRYVDTPPEIYHPDLWRVQSKGKKQGSEVDIWLPFNKAFLCNSDYSQLTYTLPQTYKSFNARGVAREQSRMVLPLSTYTTFWWTGSLKSWRRLFSLRRQADVQDETRELAELIYRAIP